MSDIVSRDVQDAVFAVQAEIMPAFSGVAPVEFQPAGEADETQATLETAAVNHVAQNCGIYMAVNRSVMDILLNGEGVAKVRWDERKTVQYEKHQRAPAATLPMLLQPKAPDEKVEIMEAEMAPDGMSASGTLRRSGRRGKPSIDSVPFSEFLCSNDFEDADKIDDVRFLAHQRGVSRSDLIALGFDKDTVYALDDSMTIDPTRTRSRSQGFSRYETGHPSTEYVMCTESYYMIDVDGDGIAERMLVVTAGGADGDDTLLHHEPWDEQPFAAGVGYLGLDDWEGTSLFDRMMMIQQAKTDLLRETMNASKRNMRQRLGVLEDDADMDDVMTSQMGGAIRCKTVSGVFPIPDVQLPQSTFAVLGYLDEMRTDRGGGAIDATASARALSQGGDWSLERMMSAAEQINAMVAKNITETMVKSIFRKLHRLLRQYAQDPLSVPGSAGWQHTEPAQWEPREDMVVSLGMSVGERARRISALQMIGQDQAGLMQAGKEGVLVDDQGIYQAKVDMARMAGLPTPEQYYVDPASPQAQQALQGQQQAQMQQAQQAQQQEQQMMEFQYGLMTTIEQLKADAKLQSQQMADQTKLIQAHMDNMQKTMDRRVDMVKIESEMDDAEAQQELDRLQLLEQAKPEERAA